MSRVPFDLVIDILSRLPVKTLLRCRCVSKAFRRLVESPSFVDLHLSRSADRNSDLNLYFIGRSFDIIGPVRVDAVDRATTTVPHYKSIRRDTYSELIGACNGLFAVRNVRTRMSIVFVNPSTKKVKRVQRLWKTFNGFRRLICGGFGYDVANDDYKVIIGIFSFPSSDIAVYSMKHNTWTPIDLAVYRHYHCPSGIGVLAGNALYWRGEPFGDNADIPLIGFDLGSEQFFHASFPHIEGGFSRLDVEGLGGCLCVCCYYNEEGFDLWVRKAEKSWVKLVAKEKGNAFKSYVKPLAYSKCGGKILFKIPLFTRYGFFWYNLENKIIEEIEILWKLQRDCDIAICESSLVLPYTNGKAGVARREVLLSRYGSGETDVINTKVGISSYANSRADVQRECTWQRKRINPNEEHGETSEMLKLDSALEARSKYQSAKTEASFAKTKHISTQEKSSSVHEHASIEQCMEILQAMDGVDNTAFVKACEKFTSCDWRRMFVAMTDERKLTWLNALN